MQIILVSDADQVGERAADVLEQTVHAKPDAVLGFATGSSPVPVYEALRRRHLDLRSVTGFALDEYVDIPPEHPQSYASVIRREVVERLGLDPEKVRVPDGLAADLDRAAQSYEEAIRNAGGIDAQLLGIGANGHIGFNEPASSFASRTRVTALTESTREGNSRFFASVDEVPTHCITQGLGTILDARRLVLVAYGDRKAAAIARAVEGPVTSMCPASAIQLHPRVSVIVDEAAGARLSLQAYYRYAAAHPARRRIPDEEPR
ncbi:MAG TPA: glucosamine-6-phosphate deaminase [Propionibacteriaceae bacterium]|nr:glucosamine-6-phosphate deaminase [Propionibacteriaceae bacterium]